MNSWCEWQLRLLNPADVYLSFRLPDVAATELKRRLSSAGELLGDEADSGIVANSVE
jgi:hypothetical protein